MPRKLLLHEEDKIQRIKEIMILENPHKLKLMLNKLSWRILVMLHSKEMYPMEVARELGLHEQKVYYHIRKLSRVGAIAISREVEKRGAVAKYYKTISPAFGVEIPDGYVTRHMLSPIDIGETLQKFFNGFIKEDGRFTGKIVVGSPLPHGPFRTSARDGHYASFLTFFLGQLSRIPREFVIKLDVDVKAEKEEKNNLILVGGPGTNLLTQEVNDYLPVRFNMQPSGKGFLFGGLVSRRTSTTYTADSVGLIARIANPWNRDKRIIVLAGNKAVGTKACVLALTNFNKKALKRFRDESTFAVAIQGFDTDGDGKVDSIEVLE